MTVPMFSGVQQRRHEVSTGGTDSDGGWIQIDQNHLTPDSDFCSDFANVDKYSENFL